MAVHDLRPEDVALIKQWLRARSGEEPEPITVSEIYKSDTAPPAKFWSQMTWERSQRLMQAFARRCTVPLREIGMDASGIFITSLAKAEISAYAGDYAARNKRKLDELATSIAVEEEKAKGLIPWRTPGWNAFIDTGTEFYNWMERQGLRPRGSNPFMDIRRLPQLHASKNTIIVAAWYEKILQAPKTPRQAAIFALLLNGLRCREVANAMVKDFVFEPLGISSIRVVGKGNKVRTVILYGRNAQAVNTWLRLRSFSASPWIFPRRSGAGKPFTVWAIIHIVRIFARTVFPGPDGLRIAKKITPHKFRHFYTSDAHRRGMKPAIIQAQLGHERVTMQQIYTHMDPEWVRKEVHAIDRGEMIHVSRTGSAHLLRRTGDSGYVRHPWEEDGDDQGNGATS